MFTYPKLSLNCLYFLILASKLTPFVLRKLIGTCKTFTWETTLVVLNLIIHSCTYWPLYMYIYKRCPCLLHRQYVHFSWYESVLCPQWRCQHAVDCKGICWSRSVLQSVCQAQEHTYVPQIFTFKHFSAVKLLLFSLFWFTWQHCLPVSKWNRGASISPTCWELLQNKNSKLGWCVYVIPQS